MTWTCWSDSSMTAAATASGRSSLIVRAAGPETRSSYGLLTPSVGEGHELRQPRECCPPCGLPPAPLGCREQPHGRRALISTAAGRPLRVTRTRSCSRWTRSTYSEKRFLTVRSDSVVMATIVHGLGAAQQLRNRDWPAEAGQVDVVWDVGVTWTSPVSAGPRGMRCPARSQGIWSYRIRTVFLVIVCGPVVPFAMITKR